MQKCGLTRLEEKSWLTICIMRKASKSLYRIVLACFLCSKGDRRFDRYTNWSCAGFFIRVAIFIIILCVGPGSASAASSSTSSRVVEVNSSSMLTVDSILESKLEELKKTRNMYSNSQMKIIVVDMCKEMSTCHTIYPYSVSTVCIVSHECSTGIFYRCFWP